MRRARRETRQSPFKVPDNNSIFLLSAKEKKDQKEVGVRLNTNLGYGKDLSFLLFQHMTQILQKV